MTKEGEARKAFLMSKEFNQKPRYCKASGTLYCRSQNSLDCAIISCVEGAIRINQEGD